jgi:hypothetical protein
MAVIVTAIEDWRSGTLRARRDAQTFLFDGDSDFNEVCARAGLDAATFRGKLMRIGSRVEMEGLWICPEVGAAPLQPEVAPIS